MSLNLYKISQDVASGYDTYSDAIVAAESEEDAKKIHPAGYGDEDWYDKEDVYLSPWASRLEDVKVEQIGIALPHIERGVVCASFHAG